MRRKYTRALRQGSVGAIVMSVAMLSAFSGCARHLASPSTIGVSNDRQSPAPPRRLLLPGEPQQQREREAAAASSTQPVARSGASGTLIVGDASSAATGQTIVGTSGSPSTSVATIAPGSQPQVTRSTRPVPRAADAPSNFTSPFVLALGLLAALAIAAWLLTRQPGSVVGDR